MDPMIWGRRWALSGVGREMGSVLVGVGGRWGLSGLEEGERVNLVLRREVGYIWLGRRR